MERDKRADLAVSDYSQLAALRDFLGWAVPGVRVLLIPGRAGRDERSILALLASRAGMVSAVRTLSQFLMSRRPALSITITVGGTAIELTATNVDEVIPVLERALAG
jgi:membrane-associated two-gene conflict system component 1 (EACC1)